jgi:hypothetical protein
MTALFLPLNLRVSLHTAYSNRLKQFLLPNLKPEKIATPPASLIVPYQATERD